MKTVHISLDDKGKIILESKDFADNLQDLFHVLATSTRQIAKLIEDDK